MQSITDKIKQHSFLNLSNKYVVGLSGGVDSVVLLHILHSLGFNCVALHCNFQLRGEESERDEAFAKNFSATFGIPFYSVSFNTKQYASEKGVSIEMAARELRYAWFEEMRELVDAQSVLVAHHTDDVVETFLMNIVRGTGIRGLSGIKAVNGNVCRPMLSCTRLEIEDYAKKNDLTYVVDSSNLEQVYIRNKFRLGVIPLLEEINPSVRQTILTEINRLAEVEQLFEDKIQDVKSDLLFEEQGLFKIDINRLLEQKAVSTVLYEILGEFDFKSDQISAVVDSLDKESGKQFFSKTHRLIKDRDALIIQEIVENTADKFLIEDGVASVSEPIKLSLQLETMPLAFEKGKECAYLDKSKLRFPLMLRKWQAGDSFVPFGMKGRKKLSDYFVDEKLSLVEKETVWVLCSGDDIIWVVGQRTDNRYRVDVNTSMVLIIKNLI